MVIFQVHFKWVDSIISSNPNYIQCLLDVRVKPLRHKGFYI